MTDESRDEALPDYMLPAPLPISIGREDSLRSIESALEETTAVVIDGEYGSGKTSLAMSYARTHQAAFPGGIHHVYAHPFAPLAETVGEAISQRASASTPMLLIVDELDNGVADERPELYALLNSTPNIRTIFVARSAPEDLAAVRRVSLRGLPISAFREILLSNGVDGVDAGQVIHELYTAAAGNPRLATAINGLLRSGHIRSLSQLRSLLRDWSIVGSKAGDCLDTATGAREVVTATTVNDELIAMVHNNPELLWKISPRKFEELTAELLHRQGYDVELTPASGDGGVDIYAAKSDGMGSFLYLVECKRFAPDNGVGVQIVRALHGVVEMRRATAGAIVTTSYFTSRAQAFQKEVPYRIHLHNFVTLRTWLDDLGFKT